jgi:hypothetical protein
MDSTAVHEETLTIEGTRANATTGSREEEMKTAHGLVGRIM